jgi:chromosome segregation protein
MLKRLELVGFKSFADKTEFDFGQGITAIVGPNGSGKSNIVDAVRWLLGEQSAKSLRGQEMADVIFNGSTSRRSLGLAEVSMTFDNQRGLLATEGSEVRITRRVYRSGEGEYLINNQPARLKDIKDLFLGSGAGTDAYCIIEQGRVDVLLQASNKERRSIFEEAAGISRFKAKKIETMRKLERVDQNLLRLRDIMEEVDKQLRSVKLQASKAQRYQEYSQRLQELRVALGLQDYHHLSRQLETQTAVLENLRAGLAERAARAEASEADIRRLEEELARLDEAVHEQEARLARARQAIAGEQSTLEHERGLTLKLEDDLAKTHGRLTGLNARVADLAGQAEQSAQECHAGEALCREQREAVAALEAQLQATARRLEELQQQRKSDQDRHWELAQRAGHLRNDVLQTRGQVETLRRQRERLQAKTDQAAESLATVDIELQALTQADDELQAQLTSARQTLAEQRQERERLREQGETAAQHVADLRAQRSGLASRVEVLEGLERSHEGVGSGAREVFALLESSGAAPWGSVLGMLADFLTVRRECAPLIDLALGERAQRFLVRDPAALAEALRQRGQPFSGRVSFLPLRMAEGGWRIEENRERYLAATEADGVIAWADQLVSCEHPELSHLPAHLLGDTVIVRDLAAAQSLQQKWTTPTNPGLQSAIRFITLQGELLEADGTLTVGTHHAEAGILSRKSELRELRRQSAELDQCIAQAEAQLAALRESATGLDERIGILQQTIDDVAGQAADLRSRLAEKRQRRDNLHEEVSLNRTEIGGLEEDIRRLEATCHRAQEQAQAAEKEERALEARLKQAELEVREREQERQRRQQEYTAARVALGQVEERLTGLHNRHRQIEADLQQRRQEQAQGEQQIVEDRARLLASQLLLLRASAALADWYLEKEAAERAVADLSLVREQQRQRRQALLDQTQVARSEYQQQQEQAHKLDMHVNDLRHQRDTLTARLREDYQVELAELYRAKCQVPSAKSDEDAISTEGSPAVDAGPGGANFEPGTLNVEQVNEEIAELRRKLARLGNVNLESLQELAELESRAQALQTQCDDLTAAQRTLQEIIAKINQDSRRLFTETFATIRMHFQELFRKLFGGGMADIILEDENDILECGIEINARPPGKELRSISLMSGGEKTMTAVALLLAIFRSKPSPFCILDEVDAALDEANIDRFCAVLRDFLDRSQFILITHSKKTMAAADVLYGITMQESGISKRVAVRFEDWEEKNGQAETTPQSEETRCFAGH